MFLKDTLSIFECLLLPVLVIGGCRKLRSNFRNPPSPFKISWPAGGTWNEMSSVAWKEEPVFPTGSNDWGEKWPFLCSTGKISPKICKAHCKNLKQSIPQQKWEKEREKCFLCVHLKDYYYMLLTSWRKRHRTRNALRWLYMIFPGTLAQHKLSSFLHFMGYNFHNLQV